jgi:hypothetical protein
MKSIKLLLFLPVIFVLTVSADKCNSKKTETGVYKAKLETKGICMNYTLRLLEGKLDTSLVSANWTDESTGKSYTNVFALANPCTFPSTIEQGNDFYFTIDSSGKRDCAVCMAYYPTPPKKLHIKVVEK